MSHVILLRSPSGDSLDRYESSFQSRGYQAISVPVLETVLTKLAELKRIIKNDPRKAGYRGVIITSARACEAWKKALEELLEDSSIKEDPADWSSVVFYVVGKATATALADIRTIVSSPLAPTDIRGGSESGTSERLARFILDDLAGIDSETKLLHLIGDKNRDTLPTILGDRGVEVDSLQVYETQGSSTFAQDLKDAVKPTCPASDRWWIVFFAPSAAEFVTPTLRDFFDLPLLCSAVQSNAAVARIAAIGPTTSTFLQDKLKLHVDVVSPKPTPDDLSNAILQYEKGLS